MNNYKQALEKIAQRNDKGWAIHTGEVSASIASEALAKEPDKLTMGMEEVKMIMFPERYYKIQKEDTGKAYKGKAVELAKKFHKEYEYLAPLFGYVTKEETREFNEDSQNGKLMIAVCEKILQSVPPYKEEEKCQYCGGKGWFINEDHKDFPNTQQKIDCYHCKVVPEGYYIHYGSGKYWEDEKDIRRRYFFTYDMGGIPYKIEIIANYLNDACELFEDKFGYPVPQIVKVISEPFLESKEEAGEEKK